MKNGETISKFTAWRCFTAFIAKRLAFTALQNADF